MILFLLIHLHIAKAESNKAAREKDAREVLAAAASEEFEDDDNRKMAVGGGLGAGGFGPEVIHG